MFRRIIGVPSVALLVLAGCDSRPPLAGADVEIDPAPVPALSLLRGDITAAGPEGYCVAPDVSNTRTGFAVMAGCDAISGGPDRPRINGIVTLQADKNRSASVLGNEQVFRDFLETEMGRTALSHSGDPEAVALETVTQTPGQVTAVFEDFSPEQQTQFQARQWRGFIDLDDRLVTISVRGLDEAPLSDASGQSLLEQAVAALRAANTDGPAPDDAQPAN